MDTKILAAEWLCILEYLLLHPKHCMCHRQRDVEITQNYITWTEADHTPSEGFHWLS